MKLNLLEFGVNQSFRANDFCKDARRQTMKADDVFKALEEMEFSEFLEPLKASLEGSVFYFLFLMKIMFFLFVVSCYGNMIRFVIYVYESSISTHSCFKIRLFVSDLCSL